MQATLVRLSGAQSPLRKTFIGTVTSAFIRPSIQRVQVETLVLHPKVHKEVSHYEDYESFTTVRCSIGDIVRIEEVYPNTFDVKYAIAEMIREVPKTEDGIEDWRVAIKEPTIPTRHTGRLRKRERRDAEQRSKS